eukprot:TRINITY_DN5522_c0_g1_i3.p1 TRINITY_DN5522_c0_g1~~TRINITY_DN5522_c0_g1_i3.p1  ORF type:complete len:177 (+),score=47.28 TRINITY_DN5522_c0_g1_i3:141-671(+)
MATVAVKPSRSDEVTSPEEQAAVLAKVEAYFADLAPKRPARPDRSFPEEDICVDKPSSTAAIPELKILAQLQSTGNVFSKEVNKEGIEEFKETEYYKSFPGDTEHVPMGTAFIKLDVRKSSNSSAQAADLPPPVWHHGQATGLGGRFGCNPARNDWQASPPEEVLFSSSKPERSES